jgi:P4 family phage/plasmid primase-like protien
MSDLALAQRAFDQHTFQRNHNAAADAVIAEIEPENLIYTGNRIYRWCEDKWVEIDEMEMRQKVLELLGAGNYSATTPKSISDLVKIKAYRPGVRFNKHNKYSLAVKNGVLELTDGNWELRPHYREDYRTIISPVTYDPQAGAPRFKRFLFEIFEGSSDAAQREAVLIEALGIALLTTCEFETFFLLIGSGANGKSVYLKVVIGLLGAESVCAVQPSQFENQFQRAHLEGKLANIISEIAEGAEIHDAQLKSLVSGELTTAERKFSKPFDFFPTATHFFASNHLPHTRDFSPALFRRAIVIDFPKVFDGASRDTKLTDTLMGELPGILNLALEGAKRVIQQGGFTIPISSIEAAAQWRLEADQVAQFVEEVCERAAGSEIESGEVFRQYQTWANNSGIQRKLNRKNFSNRLERLKFQLKKGTGGVRLITGIRIVRYQSREGVA